MSAVPNGRDGAGRFTVGNPGGPGNPRLRLLGEHQRALASAISPEQVSELMQKLLARAMLGDMQAARLLLERLFGKVPEAVVLANVGPVQPAELDHGDGAAGVAARVIAAAAAGDCDLHAAERLVALVAGIGAARQCGEWGRLPDPMMLHLRHGEAEERARMAREQEGAEA